MPELKPCPFCGAKATIFRGQSMQCANCAAEGPLTGDRHTGNRQQDLETAIELWNRREG